MGLGVADPEESRDEVGLEDGFGAELEGVDGFGDWVGDSGGDGAWGGY